MDLRCKSYSTKFDHIGITEFTAKNNKNVLKLFDTNTGEVYEDTSYQIKPFKKIDPFPREANSEEQALDFRSTIHKFYTKPDDRQFGDLEKIKSSHGEKILLQVLKITKHIKVHNVAFIKRDTLVDILGCSNSNLNRKLNMLVDRNIIRFETKGLTVPKTIKIIVNPFYFFFGSCEQKMREWMTFWCYKAEGVSKVCDDRFAVSEEELSNPVDDYITGYDINLTEPDGRIKKGEVSEAHMYKDKTKNRKFSQEDLIYLIYGI